MQELTNLLSEHGPWAIVAIQMIALYVLWKRETNQGDKTIEVIAKCTVIMERMMDKFDVSN